MRNKLLSSIIVMLALIISGCNSDSGGVDTIRGPLKLSINGDPNGLWWDSTDKKLYIADEKNQRLIVWSDSKGFGETPLALPPAIANQGGLGQVVRLADNSFVVTQFGFGVAGSVIHLSPQNVGNIAQGIDTKLRRIGLTITDKGELFDCGFAFVSTDNTRAGVVNRLTITPTTNQVIAQETTVIQGFSKIVGCLVVGETLYISEQDKNRIFSVPLSKLSSTPLNIQDLSVVAQVDTPQLLTAVNGDILTGASGGVLQRIHPNGQVETLSTGYQQVRGTAYDAANRRLFISDLDIDKTDGTTNFIYIIPID
jgi:hypothetical protein